MNNEAEGAFVNGLYDESESLRQTQEIVFQALSTLGLGLETYDLLGFPKCVLTVRFPVAMDDGFVRVFTGYRSLHSNSNGPVKGGVLFLPHVNEAEIEALSISMSVKSGIAGLPFGGSKGAVICNPRELSFSEVERISRAYIRAISEIVGPAKDIPAPDGLANAQNVAWMVDEFSALSEKSMPGFISGKPLVLGGTLGRNHVNARSIMVCLAEAVKVCNMSLQNARVVIQGYSNVGSSLSQMLDNEGAIIVGISDMHGAIYNPKGLDIKELLEKRDSFGAVTKLYPNRVSNEELLTSPCDIIIFTNSAEPMDSSLLQNIKAKTIIEATNRFVSSESVEKFQEKGIIFIPGILADLGSAIISYLEWAQNRDGYYLTESEVQSRMDKMIRSGIRTVFNTAKKYQVDLRLSSYITGILRLADTAKLRGWI